MGSTNSTSLMERFGFFHDEGTYYRETDGLAVNFVNSGFRWATEAGYDGKGGITLSRRSDHCNEDLPELVKELRVRYPESPLYVGAVTDHLEKMVGPKKACIVHNTSVYRCWCPDEVSQGNEYRYEVTRPELPPIARLSGEEPMEGPVTLTWVTTRNPDESFTSKCVQAKGAKETRYY